MMTEQERRAVTALRPEITLTRKQFDALPAHIRAQFNLKVLEGDDTPRRMNRKQRRAHASRMRRAK